MGLTTDGSARQVPVPPERSDTRAGLMPEWFRETLQQGAPSDDHTAQDAHLTNNLTTKYGFRILEEGVVSFALPAGANYVDLYADAMAYCDDKRHGRERPAMDAATYEWIFQLRKATTQVPELRNHEVQGVLLDSADMRAVLQGALLEEYSLKWGRLQVVAAAAVLYYCETGNDLFQGKKVRTDLPATFLCFGDSGVTVLDGRACNGFPDVCCAGERR